MSALAALSADQVVGFVLLDLAIILLVARAVGGLALRLGQPRVVGEIVAGVLLGPSLLGATLFVWGDPWPFLHCDAALAAAPAGSEPSITACLFPPQSRSVLGAVGQLALLLFMFLVGLELDLESVAVKARSVAIMSVGVVGFPVVLGFAIGPVLYSATYVAGFGTDAAPSQLAFSLFVGAMLAVTAFPVMARILQEKGLVASPMGVVGVVSAAVVTVLMFVLISMARAVAEERGVGGIVVNVALVAGYSVAMLTVVRRLLEPLGRRYQEAGELSAGMFAAVFVGLFASAYVAHQLGITVIVGGFLFALSLPMRRELFREFGRRLADLTVVVLLPVFLAFSGLNTDFTVLGLSAVGGVVLFLVAGVMGKWLGGAVSGRLAGLSWAEGNVIGILMNCRGLLVLVAALIGLQAGVISPQLQAAAVVMALVTTAMTGPLLDRYLPAPDAAAPREIE